MSDLSLYDHTDESLKNAAGYKRRRAVEVALQIIHSNAMGSSNHDRLDNHMENLSHYADLIQEALKSTDR